MIWLGGVPPITQAHPVAAGCWRGSASRGRFIDTSSGWSPSRWLTESSNMWNIKVQGVKERCYLPSLSQGHAARSRNCSCGRIKGRENRSWELSQFLDRLQLIASCSCPIKNGKPRTPLYHWCSIESWDFSSWTSAPLLLLTLFHSNYGPTLPQEVVHRSTRRIWRQ